MERSPAEVARVDAFGVRCEICDQLPLNPGDGWVVAHWPGRSEWLALPIVVALASAPPLGVKIYTCGSEVCVFRAKHHGVPGASYQRRAAPFT
jgi:hypothetical protein